MQKVAIGLVLRTRIFEGSVNRGRVLQALMSFDDILKIVYNRLHYLQDGKAELVSAVIKDLVLSLSFLSLGLGGMRAGPDKT